MRRHLLFATVLLWLSPQTVCAQANLAWDNCPAEGGTLSRLSDCNTNAGSNTLVVSLVWPGPEAKFVGMDLSLDILAAYPSCRNGFCPSNECSRYPLPSYWLSCRSSAISVSNDFTGAPFDTSSACHALGTTPVQWNILWCNGGGDRTPEKLVLLAYYDLPEDARPTLHTGTEYYAFRIVFTNDKTVGTGACPGCCTPVWMALSNGDGEAGLIVRAEDQGVLALYKFKSSQAYPDWRGSPSACSTPEANTTWGRVKAIYR